MSRRQQLKLTGGLPFPPPPGGKRATPARPLAPSKTALSPAQATSEASHQQSAITWLKWWGGTFPVLRRTFHVANEFNAGDAVRKQSPTGRVYYTSRSGAKRRAEGVMPGIFDFMNLANSRGFSGLAIDLKVRGNDLSVEPEKEWDQTRERDFLISQGKSAHAAWSWAEVAALHVWYFELRHAQLWRSIGRLDIYLIAKGGHDRRCGCGLKLKTLYGGL